MATGIITLLGTALALVFWIVKRKAVKADDPILQNEKRIDDTQKAVAGGNADAVNTFLDDNLRRLREDTHQGDQPGQTGDSSGNK